MQFVIYSVKSNPKCYTLINNHILVVLGFISNVKRYNMVQYGICTNAWQYRYYLGLFGWLVWTGYIKYTVVYSLSKFPVFVLQSGHQLLTFHSKSHMQHNDESIIFYGTGLSCYKYGSPSHKDKWHPWPFMGGENWQQWYTQRVRAEL